MRSPLSHRLAVLACVLLSACTPAPETTAPPLHVSAQAAALWIEGRYHAHPNGSISFGFPGVALHGDFYGQQLHMRAFSSTGNNRLALYLDDQPAQVLTLTQTPQDISLIASDTPVQHRVRIVHLNESWQGTVTLEGFTVTAATLTAPPTQPARRLLLIGDSITCGDAVVRADECRKDAHWWHAELTYGKLVARALDAQVHLVCHGGRGLIRSWNNRRDENNAADFFQLAISDDQQHLPWDHQRYQPDLILIMLGTNDFNLAIGALPEREEYVGAYVDFIRTLRNTHPQATLVLTEGPMVNDDGDPARPQKTVLRDYLADTVRRVDHPQVVAINATHYPGDTCDAHPTGAQHRAMAEDLVPVLKGLMDW